VSLAWQATRHLGFAANYVAYLFGDFVTQTQPYQHNGNYVNASVVFRF
jgi:phosphate-selective porin